jgi:hypothetical protein
MERARTRRNEEGLSRVAPPSKKDDLRLTALRYGKQATGEKYLINPNKGLR